MNKTPSDLYKETIQILECVELAVPDRRQFHLIRKKLLDLANDILKCGDTNAE